MGAGGGETQKREGETESPRDVCHVAFSGIFLSDQY